jgi:hypothetical protein
MGLLSKHKFLAGAQKNINHLGKSNKIKKPQTTFGQIRKISKLFYLMVTCFTSTP